MNYQEFKNCIIARCAQLGVTDYELYYQTAESTSVSAFQREINQFSSAVEGGVCFRCIRDGKMGYASTEHLSEKSAARIVKQALENAASLEAEEPVFLGEGGKTYARLEPTAIRIPETDALVRRCCQPRINSILPTRRSSTAAPRRVWQSAARLPFSIPGAWTSMTKRYSPALWWRQWCKGRVKWPTTIRLPWVIWSALTPMP